MNIIGIDLGTSLAKIIQCDFKGNLITGMILGEKDVHKVLDLFISSNNIDIDTIEVILLTGVSSSTVTDEEIKGIKVVRDNEFLCLARGGLELSGKEEAIIASMGTGTAFVRVQGDDIKHVGGTGVGGGTLLGFCHTFLGTNSFEEAVELISKGDLSKVDLTIGDITVEEIPNLPKDITACNFGKLEKGANESDIAFGIINMIYEIVGMMAIFVAKNDTIKDIVLVGSLTKVPYIEKIFTRFKSFCDLNFVIPENAEFAVAIGAVKRYLEN